MKEGLLIKYIKSNRDCDAALLDAAVKKGLRRALDGRLDTKKIICLARACVIAAVLCAIINTEPVSSAAPGFLINSSSMAQENSEALQGHIINAKNKLIQYGR